MRDLCHIESFAHSASASKNLRELSQSVITTISMTTSRLRDDIFGSCNGSGCRVGGRVK
jgi:hypothetical protein